MKVSISDYGDRDGGKFIEYSVSGLSDEQMNFLNDNLEEETCINNNMFTLTMYFDDKLYPFQSDASKIKIKDFVAREEIEMTIFLAGFLDDM